MKVYVCSFDDGDEVIECFVATPELGIKWLEKKRQALIVTTERFGMAHKVGLVEQSFPETNPEHYHVKYGPSEMFAVRPQEVLTSLT